MIIPLTLTIEDVDTDVVEIPLLSQDKAGKSSLIQWVRKEMEPVGPEYELVINTTQETEGSWKIEIEKKCPKFSVYT